MNTDPHSTGGSALHHAALQRIRIWLGLERAPLAPGEQPYLIGGKQCGIIEADGSILFENVRIEPMLCPRCKQAIKAQRNQASAEDIKRRPFTLGRPPIAGADIGVAPEAIVQPRIIGVVDPLADAERENAQAEDDHRDHPRGSGGGR